MAHLRFFRDPDNQLTAQHFQSHFSRLTSMKISSDATRENFKEQLQLSMAPVAFNNDVLIDGVAIDGEDVRKIFKSWTRK